MRAVRFVGTGKHVEIQDIAKPNPPRPCIKSITRTWMKSVQGAVATWSNPWESKINRNYRRLITDQVAHIRGCRAVREDFRK